MLKARHYKAIKTLDDIKIIGRNKEIEIMLVRLRSIMLEMEMELERRSIKELKGNTHATPDNSCAITHVDDGFDNLFSIINKRGGCL